MTTLPINEVFLTVQGEATFAGTPAVFIRTQGCTVGCAFCDTKHTWDVAPAKRRSAQLVVAKTESDDSWARFTPEELVDQVKAIALGARHVVITGGEPADHDLTELTMALMMSGYSVQLETSGTAPVRVCHGTFVTVSPKIGMAGAKEVLQQAMARADEIKHPTGTDRHFHQLQELLARGWHRPDIPIWLQPLSMSEAATGRCVGWCMSFGYRLSIQTHKYVDIR